MNRILGLLSVAAATMAVALIASSARAGFPGPTIFTENFEGTFPGSWSVGDSDAAGTPAYWGAVVTGFGGQTPHGGSHMAYCAATGHGGTLSNPTYQNHMAAFMQRDIDLTAYSSAALSFWYLIPSLDDFNDTLSIYVDGTLTIWVRNYHALSWTQVTLPLNVYVGGIHTISFVFTSDSAITAEGVYIDDVVVSGTPATATISDAWWNNQIDMDGDGYMSYALIAWNSDVVGGIATLQVYENIYYKRASSSTWTFFKKIGPRTITGARVQDIWNYNVYQGVIPGLTHDKYDWKIAVYRDGHTVPDFVRSSANDADLNDVKLESGAEEVDYLRNDQPVSWSACPWNCGFDIRSSRWAAVALNPSPNDKDLSVSPHWDLSSPTRISNAAGHTIDFIVLNGTILHSRPYYARVQDGAASAYWIEAENSPPNLAIGSTLSGRHFTANEVFDLYQANLTAGHKYTVRVAQSGGSTANVAVFAFKPSRTTASRSQRDFSRNSVGVGKTESLTFKAKYSGKWAIVVTNENAGAGAYSVKVTRVN